MWAQFNIEGNYIPSTAGSLPPWGTNYRAERLWRAEGWRNDLPDDWMPPKLLNVLIAEAWGRVKALRDTAERAPLPYMGKLLDFDSISSERLTWAIDAARTALTQDILFAVDWTCADNTTLTMSAADIIGIPLAVAMRSDALHQQARALRVALDAATSAEQIAEIESQWEA